MRVYYQDINFLIVEAITKLFKAEIKLYSMGKNAATDDKKQSKSPNKQAVLSNVCLVEKIFSIIRKVFLERTGVDCKYFIKLSEKLIKFKEDLNW